MTKRKPTPKARPSELIAYIRVSDMGERSADSVSTQTVDQQREAIAAICRLSNAEVVDEVVALNASGGKDWPEPKLADAIARVDADEADGIVVYDLTRWGRHLAALEVIERWAEQGKMFLAANDKFDVTSASGRLGLRMMMVVARFYWEQLRDRFVVAEQRAFARGAFLGRTPFGYQNITDPTDPKVGCIVPDQEWGPVVTRAFEIAATDGMHATMAYLEERAPHKRWRTDDVRRMLRNDCYLGYSTYDGVTKLTHEPLTTEAHFHDAQTKPRMRRSNADYPLSHIATCGKCGAGLVGAYQTVRGTRYRRMRCSSPACHGGSSITADTLETYVLQTLKLALSDKVIRDSFSPDGLDEALAAATAAEEQFVAYMSNAAGLDTSSKAFQIGAKAHEDRFNEARLAYEEIASAARRHEVLPSTEELDDPDQYARALSVMVERIVVTPGRGAVSDRVQIVPRSVLDGEHVARAWPLAA